MGKHKKLSKMVVFGFVLWYSECEVVTLTIGERIKEKRETAGLTQEELGERLGVTGVAIMRYEKNQRQPRLEQLRRIAIALNTSVSELVEPGYWGTLTPEDEKDFFGPDGQQRVITALKQMTQAGVEKVADYEIGRAHV